MQRVCVSDVAATKRWLTSCTPGHMLPCRALEPELFSSLRKLQELRLDDNAVRTIYPAMGVNGGLQACFPQLRVLQLSNNRLLDQSECANRIAAIPLLTEVAVSGNPFTRKHQVSCPYPSIVTPLALLQHGKATACANAATNNMLLCSCCVVTGVPAAFHCPVQSAAAV